MQLAGLLWWLYMSVESRRIQGYSVQMPLRSFSFKEVSLKTLKKLNLQFVTVYTDESGRATVTENDPGL